MEKGLRVAFIFSNWYSGATLFAILLNNHHEITCNGETYPFRPGETDKYTCSCGKQLHECSFYKKAGSHMINKDCQYGMNELFSIFPNISKNNIMNRFLSNYNYMYKIRDVVIDIVPSYRGKVKEFVDAHLKFFRNACAFEGTTYYIDGTKMIRRAELFAKYTEIEFKVIHLIRDGRAFGYSYLKHNPHLNYDLPKILNGWKKYIEMVDVFTHRYPKIPAMTIRYEDLCNNLVESLESVCDFLELSFNLKMTKCISGKYHVLGNVMRKKFNGNINEDLSWKSNLSNNEIDKMSLLIENELKRFGYLE